MTARPPATITAVAVRISLGILLIGFKCGLLSSLQTLGACRTFGVSPLFSLFYTI